MTDSKGARGESVIVCCVQVPGGRWVSLEPVGLLILDKDKDKPIHDHRCLMSIIILKNPYDCTYIIVWCIY